jgi:hypothetical protein
MIRFDSVEDVDSNEDAPMITCQIHGEYPASLKSYGCPDCAEEVFDDEELDDWKDRQARRTPPK